MSIFQQVLKYDSIGTEKSRKRNIYEIRTALYKTCNICKIHNVFLTLQRVKEFKHSSGMVYKVMSM